jgi:hypothetical protein
MGIHLSWYDSNENILVWKFEGEWNWLQYHAAINRAVMMIKRSHHTVDSIMDLRENKSLPPNAILNGKRWFVVAPNNFGVTVVMGANGLIQGIASAIGSIYKPFNTKIMLANTLDQALQVILEKQQQRIKYATYK